MGLTVSVRQNRTRPRADMSAWKEGLWLIVQTELAARVVVDARRGWLRREAMRRGTPRYLQTNRGTRRARDPEALRRNIPHHQHPQHPRHHPSPHRRPLPGLAEEHVQHDPEDPLERGRQQDDEDRHDSSAFGTFRACRIVPIAPSTSSAAMTPSVRPKPVTNATWSV